MLGEQASSEYCDEACRMIENAVGEKLHFTDTNEVADFHEDLRDMGANLVTYPVCVLSEAQVSTWQENWLKDIETGAEVLTEARAGHLTSDKRSTVVHYCHNRTWHAVKTSCLVLATGRAGISWSRRQLEILDVPLETPNHSIGVRFEMNASTLEMAGVKHPDLKVSAFGQQGAKAKSFCFCGGRNGGRIKFTHYQDAFHPSIVTLDGHVTSSRTDNNRLAANFGVLTQIDNLGSNVSFKKNLDDFILRYEQILQGRPGVQTLRSFIQREDDNLTLSEMFATLSFDPSVVDYRMARLDALFTPEQHEAIVLGYRSVLAAADSRDSNFLDDTIVAGPELEFLWHRPTIDSNGRVQDYPIWVVGDMAGIAQGIVQAAMFGLAAAKGVKLHLGLGTR